LRVVATTTPTPIPPLVGAADLPEGEAAKLRDALLSVAASDELKPLRDTLLLRGFAQATAETYEPLRDAAQQPTAMGDPTLERGDDHDVGYRRHARDRPRLRRAPRARRQPRRLHRPRSQGGSGDRSGDSFLDLRVRRRRARGGLPQRARHHARPLRRAP